MKRYSIIPEYEYKSWGDYDDLEEAKRARCELQFTFMSRSVSLIDNLTGEEV